MEYSKMSDGTLKRKPFQIHNMKTVGNFVSTFKRKPTTSKNKPFLLYDSLHFQALDVNLISGYFHTEISLPTLFVSVLCVVQVCTGLKYRSK